MHLKNNYRQQNILHQTSRQLLHHTIYAKQHLTHITDNHHIATMTTRIRHSD